MAVKFDKDMILKHRFWIMLGVSVTLVLTGILILTFSESDAYGKLKTAIGEKGNPTDNQKTIDEYTKEAQKYQGEKSNVWKAAYDAQAPDFTWPDAVERAYDFHNGYFANEITISKLNKDKKSWPPDSDFLIHGEFLRQENDWVEILARGVPVPEPKKEPAKKVDDKEKSAPKAIDKSPAKDKGITTEKTPATNGKTLPKTPPKTNDPKLAKDTGKTPDKTAAKEKTKELEKGLAKEKDLPKGIAKDTAKDNKTKDLTKNDKTKDLNKNFAKDKEKAKPVADRVVKLFVTEYSRNVKTDDPKEQDAPFTQMTKYAKGKMLTIKCQRGKYFNDPLTANESRVYKDSYLTQIDPILHGVDPLDIKGNGVVQLKNWLYKKGELPHQATGAVGQKFLHYVSEPWPEGGAVISKEAWVAQEDLWIQKEIYRMIRSANDSVSNFASKTPGERTERNKAYVFQNSYFELELQLDKDEALSFKIKNRLQRRQSIDLSFKVLLNNGPGYTEEVIKISGLPLQPAATKDDSYSKTFPRGKDERTGVFSVRQVLNWQTAAVKRIDQITIGSPAAHSHRTYPIALRCFDEAEFKARQAKAGAAAGKDGKPAPAGVIDLVPREKGGGAGQGAGALAMGLWSDRYLEGVSEQSRRLPVAVVLIVDQGHVDRVLNSFNNSKLRFLETQVLLNQYTGSLQPPAPVEEKEKDDGGAPNKGIPKFLPMPMGGGPGPMGGVGREQPAVSSDMETNMELVIYGIVTLYQKYPPRPPLGAPKK